MGWDYWGEKVKQFHNEGQWSEDFLILHHIRISEKHIRIFKNCGTSFNAFRGGEGEFLKFMKHVFSNILVNLFSGIISFFHEPLLSMAQ